MKLSNNEESKTGSGCAPFKEAAPKVRLRCAEGAAKRHDGKSVPKELLQLHHLVGNPNTEEHVWMNACIGAGAQSLEPSHNLLYKVWSALQSSCGALFAIFTLLINFCAGIFLCAQSNYLVTGVNVDSFIRPFSETDGVGLLVALVAALCFWVSLLVNARWLRIFVVIPAILFVSSMSALAFCWTFGSGWAAILGTFIGVGSAAIAHFGLQLRESLPKSFSAARVAASGVGVLLPTAAFAVWSLYYAITGTSHTEKFANGDGDSLFFIGAIFAYCFFVHGYAIARAAKSSSRMAGAFLGSIVQAPILFGFTIAAFASAILGFSDPSMALNHSFPEYVASWKDYGLERGVLFLGMTALGLALSAGGGWVGAWRNSHLKL